MMFEILYLQINTFQNVCNLEKVNVTSCHVLSAKTVNSQLQCAKSDRLKETRWIPSVSSMQVNQ